VKQRIAEHTIQKILSSGLQGDPAGAPKAVARTDKLELSGVSICLKQAEKPTIRADKSLRSGRRSKPGV